MTGPWFHGVAFHIDPAFCDLLSAAGVRSHGDLVRLAAEGEGRGARPVAQVSLPGTPARRDFFLKTYCYGGWRILRTFLYKAKAEREFGNLRAVAAAGVPAVRPAAYGFTRRLGFITTSFILTEAFEGGRNARDLITAYARSQPADVPPAAFRAVLDAAADGLRRLHEQGLYLHTAFEKNLLVRPGAAPAAYAWVDLPFAGRHAPGALPPRRRVRDLACLNKGLEPLLRASDRLRLLRRYAGPGVASRAVKDLARRVHLRTLALRDATPGARLVRLLKGRGAPHGPI